MRLASGDSRDPPRIVHNYYVAEADRMVHRRAVRIARELLAQPPYDPYRGRETDPGPLCRTDADIDAYLERLHQTHMHPVGSCRMGTDELAVVDPQLRVHGLDGLRVADASIMPRTSAAIRSASSSRLPSSIVRSLAGVEPAAGAAQPVIRSPSLTRAASSSCVKKASSVSLSSTSGSE